MHTPKDRQTRLVILLEFDNMFDAVRAATVSLCAVALQIWQDHWSSGIILERTQETRIHTAKKNDNLKHTVFREMNLHTCITFGRVPHLPLQDLPVHLLGHSDHHIHHYSSHQKQ